jgi:hypothetical protein
MDLNNELGSPKKKKKGPEAEKLQHEYSIRCIAPENQRLYIVTKAKNVDKAVKNALAWPLEVDHKMKGVSLRIDSESEIRLLYPHKKSPEWGYLCELLGDENLTEEKIVETYYSAQEVPYYCVVMHISKSDTPVGGALISQFTQNALQACKETLEKNETPNRGRL